MVKEEDLVNAMLAFLENDDTPTQLLETLAELNKMKAFANDRLTNVG